MAKVTAMGVYVVVWVISAAMIVSATNTFAEFPSLPMWRADQLAQTGVCMLLFTTTVIWLQARSPASGFLGVQVLLTGTLLFLTFSQHAFPGRSTAFAVPHLLFALVLGTWNAVRVTRIRR